MSNTRWFGHVERKNGDGPNQIVIIVVVVDIIIIININNARDRQLPYGD